jgi:superfamily II DNA helicase RecQ
MKCKTFQLRVSKEYLDNDEDTLNQFLESVKVTQIQSAFVSEGGGYWSVLAYYEEDNKPDPYIQAEEVTMNSSKQKLYDILAKWRDNQAEYEHLPPYIVCYNQWLREIIDGPVRNMEDFNKIKGFGERRIKKYGEQIIRIIEVFNNSQYR